MQSISNAGFLPLAAGFPANPVLQLYQVKADGIINTVTVTLVSAAHLSIYYFELSSACKSLVASSANATTTAVSFSASTPPTWLTTTGDLPLAFFSSQPASTATAQSGWTNLTTLNAANGNVLNAQSGPTATGANQAYTGAVTWGTANPVSEVILLSANQSFYGFTSQMVAEAIGSDTALAHSSQVEMDVIGIDTANAHTSQAYVEAVGADTALARVSQIYIELIVPLYERTSQMVLEAIGQDTAKVRTSQMYMEVLFSSQGQRRRVVEDELFTY